MKEEGSTLKIRKKEEEVSSSGENNNTEVSTLKNNDMGELSLESVKRNTAKKFIAENVKELASGTEYDGVETAEILNKIQQKIDEDNLYLNKLCMQMISELAIANSPNVQSYIDRLAIFF